MILVQTQNAARIEKQYQFTLKDVKSSQQSSMLICSTYKTKHEEFYYQKLLTNQVNVYDLIKRIKRSLKNVGK